MVAKRYGLSDGQWARVTSLLPGKAGDPEQKTECL